MNRYLELAQQLADAARAQLAEDRKKLEDYLRAQSKQNQAPGSSSTPH